MQLNGRIWKRKDICLLPWTSLIIRRSFAETCCDFSRLLHYESYGRPWKGENIFNDDHFKLFRRSMINNGMYKTCPGSTCYRKIELKDWTCEQELQLNLIKGDKRREEMCSSLIDDISNERDEVSDGPIILDVDPGSKCDMDCVFCCAGFERKNKTERANPTNEEIKMLKPYYKNCFNFHTCGAETFAWDDNRIELLQKEIKYDFADVWAISNGKGLTLQRYEKFFINGKMTYVYLSLNSLDPKNYYLLHRSKIDCVLDNIIQITKKYPNHGIKRLSIVVTTLNYIELPEIVLFAALHGIKRIYVFSILPSFLLYEGYGEWNIFEGGFTLEIYKRLEEVIERTRLMAKIHDVVVDGLENFWNKIQKKHDMYV